MMKWKTLCLWMIVMILLQGCFLFQEESEIIDVVSPPPVLAKASKINVISDIGVDVHPVIRSQTGIDSLIKWDIVRINKSTWNITGRFNDSFVTDLKSVRDGKGSLSREVENVWFKYRLNRTMSEIDLRNQLLDFENYPVSDSKLKNRVVDADGGVINFIISNSNPKLFDNFKIGFGSTIISFESATTNNTNPPEAGGSVSFSHNVGTGDNRFLIVAVTFDNSLAASLDSVEYAGVEMDLINSTQGNTFVYGLVNPTSGNNDVRANWTAFDIGAFGAAYSVVSYNNVNQTDPIHDEAIIDNQDLFSDPYHFELDVPNTGSNDRVVGIASIEQSRSFVGSPLPHVERTDVASAGDASNSIAEKNGTGGTVTIGFNASDFGNDYAILGFSIRPEAGGDVAAPVCTITNTSITDNSAVVHADCDENANMTVNYNTSSIALGNVVTNSSFTDPVNVSITGLDPNVQYFYNVTNCDSSGNCAVSGVFNFTTSTVLTACANLVPGGQNVSYTLGNDILNYGGTGGCFNVTDSFPSSSRFTNITFDCQGNKIEGQWNSGQYGFHLVSKDNFTIKNCEISDFQYNIYFNDADYNGVINNTLWNTDVAILLQNGRLSNITNNRINGSGSSVDRGIWHTTSGEDNNVSHNNITANLTMDINFADGNRYYNNRLNALVTAITIGNSATGTLIFNNYINASASADFINIDGGSHTFNVTLQAGDNVFDSSNPNISGNYWTDNDGNYSDTCTDSDGNGFCDVAYNIEGSATFIDGLPISDEFGVPVGDTCDYSSGNFIIDCSEACTVDGSDIDVGGNQWLSTGSGTVLVQVRVFNFSWRRVSDSCHIRVEEGAGGRIG